MYVSKYEKATLRSCGRSNFTRYKYIQVIIHVRTRMFHGEESAWQFQAYGGVTTVDFASWHQVAEFSPSTAYAAFVPGTNYSVTTDWKPAAGDITSLELRWLTIAGTGGMRMTASKGRQRPCWYTCCFAEGEGKTQPVPLPLSCFPVGNKPEIITILYTNGNVNRVVFPWPSFPDLKSNINSWISSPSLPQPCGAILLW